MKSSLTSRIIGAVFVLLFAGCVLFARRVRNPLLSAEMFTRTTTQTATSQGPTVIHVNSTTLHQNVKRLGMNLGGEDFYDSQQILKNLVSRNPGFEGLEWQTVIPCGRVTVNSCVDGANNGSWPEGFLDGGSYEVITGAASGQSGVIRHSTAASAQTGAEIQFAQAAKMPVAGDYIVVRKTSTGDATGGWDAQLIGGATISTELKDLPPNSPGTQAVKLSAPTNDQGASLKQYFDSTPGRSYVQLRGPYVVRFRAKGLGGNNSLTVAVERAWAAADGPILRQSVPLTTSWKQYSIPFEAHEPTGAVGTVAFGLSVNGGEALVDDVSLTETDANGTAFRNDVVAVLQKLQPGVLRYMDSGGNWGSDLDNMLAPEWGRKRSGFSRYSSTSGDIPIGLHDFLVLCEKIGAEPWYSLQLGMSNQDVAHLMEYLGAPASTKYGALRISLGHPEPWTKTFQTIHLEYGNESWNSSQPGASMADANAYAERIKRVFEIVRSTPAFSTSHFNLIANGQVVNTYLTQTILDKAKGIDTIDFAPYTFSTFADDSSTEAIFGPMFAEPQLMDASAAGVVNKQAMVVAKVARPVNVAIYETNIGTSDGTASQASLNSVVPSVGAGISSVDHMLLMLRELGITVQNTFQLAGGGYHFNDTSGRNRDATSPVWAVTVDMGGPANRVRPSFLAQQLANRAIRPTMLTTALSGSNPVWNQAKSTNDNIELNQVHELQSFAFTDGSTDTLIVLNLSRTAARTIGLDGACAPQGTVAVETLTSANITDTNEHEDKVKIVSRQEHDVMPEKSTFTLPPFSLTSFASPSHGCKPTR
jgi:alpha-L-arabinofuranosidase